MAKRRLQPARSRSRRSSQPFLEKGVAALLLGGIMWVPSLLSVSSPILKMVAQSIRTPALFAMGVGALLLATHGVLQFFKRRNAALPPRVEPTLGEQPAAPAQPAGTPPAPATLQAEPPAQPPPTEWSKDVLAAVEWRRFEALVEALFAQAGFETRSQSHGADGGVDIWLYSKHADGPVAVVQCKHWQGKAVGVREVREFLG